MPEHRFDLVGGHAALDFVNTIHDWLAAAPKDYLETYRDAVRFGEAAGVLTRSEGRRLGAAAPRRELVRLRRLRTRLERVYRALITQKAPSPEDLGLLAEVAAEAARAGLLRRVNGRLARVIEVERAGPAALRLRLIEAAMALLTSPAMARVKSCPSCGWFFLDKSRNGSRRWCQMATCGNNAKARAWYRRHRRHRRPMADRR
jgi:predicted RNA-binding Zn ribbon-like protein